MPFAVFNAPAAATRHFVRRWGVSLLAALAFLSVASHAQDDSTSGRFEVRSAYTQKLDGVYHVSAEIDYGLTEAAIDALSNGVPLTFKLDIEVLRARRWLPDTSAHKLLQRHELSFHALTERYLVRNLNSGEQRSYATLSAALRGLGTIDRLPVIDASLLNEDRDYRISMRSTLDIKSLSGPLRLLASLFRFNDWRLASEWHTWALNP